MIVALRVITVYIGLYKTQSTFHCVHQVYDLQSVRPEKLEGLHLASELRIVPSPCFGWDKDHTCGTRHVNEH